MADIEKVKKGVWQCWLPSTEEEYATQCHDCPYYEPGITLDECMTALRKDVLELLKEQDERYVSMVISWLREIAINNVDSNREMTFLDAVEDIRDRASYGLKQYFIDKQEGR